jgi:GT2 family glycosyltransferase/2-polyprenyl-3-methyl-5-hydroxy-6-metoxy-1,4-benzoquinol methylase
MNVSVLVVNLNNLQFTKDCVSDLISQDCNFNLTIIDQNSSEEGTKEYFSTLPSNIEFIQNESNTPLNRLWNWFVIKSNTPYICLLNNDVRIAPNFLSSSIKVFERESNVGFVNHVSNNKDYQEWSNELNYKVIEEPYRQGWDLIFRKENYNQIPSELSFFYGDDYIYSKLYSSGMKGAYVLNSPMIHFERSTTVEKGGQRDASPDGLFFSQLDLEYKNMSFVEELSKWKPEFNKIKMKEKYSKESYITRDANIENWESHLNTIILNQYSDIIKGRVADFGCNHGACTIIAARNANIKSIIGIDINQESILVAENLLSNCNEPIEVKSKVRYQVGDLTNLNRISDNYFDSATCFHTLEHIYQEDYNSVFSEWKRVIKDGGHFIVSVPYLRAYDDPCHVNYFDENSLSELFTQQGFEVVDCYRDNREGFDCLNIVSKVNKKEIDLSILICSLTERRNTFLDRLLDKLEPQVKDKNVELLIFSDNAKRSIGQKRNDAIKMARGKYTCFIDDDDLVSDDYVDLILKEIRDWSPDVIVFDALITFDEQRPKLVKYGREFDYCEKEEAYYRHPNHLMVHKKSNITEWFQDIKTGEDDEWASRMLDRIVTQSRIEKILYYYEYRTTTKKYYE